MMHLIPYSQDQSSNDKLLSIAVRCNATNLNDICKMQADFAALLGNSSESVKDILMNSDEETAATSVISHAKWPVGWNYCAFGLDECLVRQD